MSLQGQKTLRAQSSSAVHRMQQSGLSLSQAVLSLCGQHVLWKGHTCLGLACSDISVTQTPGIVNNTLGSLHTGFQVNLQSPDSDPISWSHKELPATVYEAVISLCSPPKPFCSPWYRTVSPVQSTQSFVCPSLSCSCRPPCSSGSSHHISKEWSRTQSQQHTFHLACASSLHHNQVFPHFYFTLTRHLVLFYYHH